MNKITIYCDGACRGNNLPIEQRFISWFLRREDAEYNLATNTRWYI